MKPDYGIDAPKAIRNLYVGGGALILLGCVMPSGVSFLKPMLTWWGLAWVVSPTLMILYSKILKFKHRDRMLNRIQWKGDEMILDVGTGRGLLMIGAAKRLTTGKAVGIDIWNSKDLSKNSIENAQNNIVAEGVATKAEIKSEDARKMSFTGGSFDVVLSNLCIHNLSTPKDRAIACQEIARVLKPEGTAVISDFRFTKEYEQVFKSLGLKTNRLGPFWLSTFPPLTIIEAKKEK